MAISYDDFRKQQIDMLGKMYSDQERELFRQQSLSQPQLIGASGMAQYNPYAAFSVPSTEEDVTLLLIEDDEK